MITKEFSRNKLVKDFITKSYYLPIVILPYTSYKHLKITFINVLSKDCDKAFNFQKYFF